MAETKRLQRELDRDRLLISELFVKGKSHLEITDIINQSYEGDRKLSRRQISADIQTIVTAWQERASDDIGKLRAEQLAKIDKLEETYWQAWERSLALDKKFTRVGSQPVSQVMTESDGNPAFLQGVERCIAQRCKLLGLDRVVKQIVEIEGMSDDKLVQHVAGILESVGIRLGGSSAQGIEPEPETSPEPDRP